MRYNYNSKPKNSIVEINGTEINVTTVFDKSIAYEPTEFEVERVKHEARELLNTYFDHLSNEYGLDTLFEKYGRFWKRKGWLIKAFERSPFYNGNFQIVLRNESMIRSINADAIEKFLYYFESRITEAMYDLSYEDRIPLRFANRMVKQLGRQVKTTLDNTVDENSESYAESYKPDSMKIHIRKGDRISKVVLKLAKMFNIDKHTDIQDASFCTADGRYIQRTKDFGWNYQYAAFTDAITPLEIPATMVISVNPIDYYTMSFGTNWASCHTIDKENLRRADHNYSGMYCGGCGSYMEDDATIIVYYISDSYKGSTPELEDKIKRCCFYLGEDKLVQSRVYPDGRDGGDQSLSDKMRGIVQRLISEMFDVPNYWHLERGTRVCCEETESSGAHYRDYTCYNDCNVSYMKRIDGHRNHKKIHIGSRHTCPECGEIHDTSDNIFCGGCSGDGIRCYNCGERYPEDEMYVIDGEYYCSSCSFYCDYCEERVVGDYRYVSHYGDICDNCLEDHFTYSSWLDEYIENDDVVETEEGRICRCGSSGYEECHICGDIHNSNCMHYDGETNAYYCTGCYEDLIDSRNEE